MKDNTYFKYIIVDFLNNDVFVNIDIELKGNNSKADITIFFFFHK